MGGFIHLISMGIDTRGGTHDRPELRTKSGPRCSASTFGPGQPGLKVLAEHLWTTFGSRNCLPLGLYDIDVDERMLPTRHAQATR